MIKLYIFYFVFGAYMLFESYGIWLFSAFNGGDNIITYMAMFSSAILFMVASGLSLYHLRWASILGLVVLMGVFPFGIHWLQYRYTYEQPLTQGIYNQVILGATVVYIVSVCYSIKYIINQKQAANKFTIRKQLKRTLALLPLFLFVVFVILDYVNP